MHVIHVIDSMHGGGAESSILEVVPGLARRGVKTSIVALFKDDNGLSDRLEQLNITPILLSARHSLEAVGQLRTVFRQLQPDIVHTSLFYSNSYGRIAGKLEHVPVVTTLANLDFGPEHRQYSKYGSWAVRAACFAEMATVPLATRFHAISNEVATVMGRRLRIPDDRIQVVYRGRDTARLGAVTADRRAQVRCSLGLSETARVVLSVGRLDQQKGVDTTIKAFSKLNKHLPDTVLLIAGRPGNASRLAEEEASGLPNIYFLGHRTDVPDLMCAADVLSFPSRWEGLGGTLVEALAMRLGIVGSSIAPVAEVIGGVDWPLVPPDDPQALADALTEVLEDRSLNKARREAGFTRFQEVFTSEAACDGMIDFYQKALVEFKRGH